MNQKISDERHLLSILLALRLGLLDPERGDNASETNEIDQSLEQTDQDGLLIPSATSEIPGAQRAAIDQIIDVLQDNQVKLRPVILRVGSELLARESTDDAVSKTVEGKSSNSIVRQLLAKYQFDSENVEGHNDESILTELSVVAGTAVDQGNDDESSFSLVKTADDIQGRLRDAESVAGNESVFHEGDRYKILEPLAEGGLGQVSVARDQQFGRNVAYKQIKAKHAAKANNQVRFVFEAAITGQLEHPGIVPVYSLGSDVHNNPFYTMRLIEGESFGEAIRNFHADESQSLDSVEFRQLLNRFVGICNAISFAHSRGVIHRDLKPDNVMLGAFGETYVVDWGLARQLNDDQRADEPSDDSVSTASGPGHTEQGSIFGTISYMSPEQARGDIAGMGATSDVYSLGGILFHLLTGKSAFPQRDRREKLEAVQAGQFRAPIECDERVPKALNAICVKAMSFEPQDRYSFANHLAADVERWMADEPVSAWEEPWTVKTGRWVRRHRTLVATGAVFMIATMVGLAVILSIQSQANRKLAAANLAESEAKEFAEQQFDVALDAIGQFHNGVANDFLLSQNEFDELRISLLESPRQFYARLNTSLESYPSPTRKQQESMMDSHVSLASIAERMGDKELAIEEFNKAIELCELLIQSNPDDEFLIQKGRILIALGDNLESTGSFDKCEACLTEAQQVFESLSAVPEQNEVAQTQLARTHSQLAVLYANTERLPLAIPHLNEAVKIRETLFNQNPDDETQRALAIVYSSRLNILADQNQADEAIEAGELAVDLFTSIDGGETRDPLLLHEFSGTVMNLAWQYQSKKEFEKALVLYRKAEQSYRQLILAAPNILNFRSGLASTLNNMGLLYSDLDKFEEAEDVYLQSLELKRQITLDFPKLVELQVSLAGGYINFGGFYHNQKDFEKGIPWYGKGVEVLEQLLEQNPDVTRAQWFLRNAYQNRARTYRALKDYENAAKDFSTLLTLDPEPALRRRASNELAQLNAFLGRHGEAVRLAGQLKEGANTDRDFFNLAFIHRLAIDAAAKDESLSDAERESVIERYVDEAVNCLREMYQTDALTRPQFVDLLKSNSYLSPMLAYPAYQAFVDEFESDE